MGGNVRDPSPSEAAAEAIAAEWAGQGEHIDRASMPLTGMLSASIDGGAEDADAWREEIVKYLGSDLVCYRAEEPQALAERRGVPRGCGRAGRCAGRLPGGGVHARTSSTS